MGLPLCPSAKSQFTVACSYGFYTAYLLIVKACIQMYGMSGAFLSFDVVHAHVHHPKLCNEAVNKLERLDWG